jgi:fatty-acyl-CoA synthase
VAGALVAVDRRIGPEALEDPEEVVVKDPVVGPPADEGGVRLREGASPLGTEEVRAFCQGRIAHYKVPRYVHVVDEFPMTVTGKIQKYKLRDAAVTLLGLEDAAAIRTA